MWCAQSRTLFFAHAPHDLCDLYHHRLQTHRLLRNRRCHHRHPPTSLLHQVRFRYIPLNHVAPNGSFACNESFACPDTRFDTCLARVTCDPLDGRCLPAAQQQLASYLACFEGPFANREVPNKRVEAHTPQSVGVRWGEGGMGDLVS